MKAVEVVAAIIVHDGKILCTQRGENKYPYLSKKFEFPGGKVENDESLAQALTREIQEELNMTISVKRLFLTVEHSYSDFNIVMHSFVCNTQSRELTLDEHIEGLWLKVAELDSLDWAAADIPIVEQLKASLS